MQNPLDPNVQVNLPSEATPHSAINTLTDALVVSAAVDGPFNNQEKEDFEPVPAYQASLQDFDQQAADELEKPHTPAEKAEQANFLSHNDGGS